MAGRIAVVDTKNRFVCWTDRATIHAERLPHRSVHIAVFDRKGRLIIQKRDRYKDTYPGHWDSSCAGHVEESDYPGGPNDQLDEVYH
ncbi:MAG: NUDIX domain-containing protein, partial [Myxococcota bacterium]